MSYWLTISLDGSAAGYDNETIMIFPIQAMSCQPLWPQQKTVLQQQHRHAGVVSFTISNDAVVDDGKQDERNEKVDNVQSTIHVYVCVYVFWYRSFLNETPRTYMYTERHLLHRYNIDTVFRLC